MTTSYRCRVSAAVEIYYVALARGALVIRLGPLLTVRLQLCQFLAVALVLHCIVFWKASPSKLGGGGGGLTPSHTRSLGLICLLVYKRVK